MMRPFRWLRFWSRPTRPQCPDPPTALPTVLPPTQTPVETPRVRLEAHFGPAAAWPHLSQTLTGPRHPHACQACGLVAPLQCVPRRDPATADGPPAPPQERMLPDGHLVREIVAWQECDEDDQPTPVAVMLCLPCGNRLISPHPRLYHELGVHAPFPGIMPLCVDCAWREGVPCRHPQAQANGGPGVAIDAPAPRHAHVCLAGGRGYGLTWSPAPVRGCAGHQPVPAGERPPPEAAR